jgi:hypothetical protein
VPDFGERRDEAALWRLVAQLLGIQPAGRTASEMAALQLPFRAEISLAM